jgi:hypothetical protein
VLGHGYKGLKWAEGEERVREGEVPSAGNNAALLLPAALLLSDPRDDDDDDD